MKQGRVHGHGDEVLRVLVKAVRIKASHRYGSSPAQTDAGNANPASALDTEYLDLVNKSIQVN